MQVPYFARHARVVTYDPRGNGASERPASGYTIEHFYRDALTVMTAECPTPPTVVGFSMGSNEAAMLAARNPDRVQNLVLIGPAIGGGAGSKDAFWGAQDTYEGWGKYNANYWLEHYDEFVQWFFGEVFH